MRKLIRVTFVRVLWDRSYMYKFGNYTIIANHENGSSRYRTCMYITLSFDIKGK